MTAGRVWPKPIGAARTKTFNVYRWNPEDGRNPRIQMGRFETERLAGDENFAALTELSGAWVDKVHRCS